MDETKARLLAELNRGRLVAQLSRLWDTQKMETIKGTVKYSEQALREL